MLEHIVAKIDIQIIKLRHFGTMFVLLVNFFELNMKNTYIMLAIWLYYIIIGKHEWCKLIKLISY